MFAFNRPVHLLKSLTSLKNNTLSSESTLYIYCDGQKPGSSAEELKKIKETRAIAKKELWCKEVILVEQKENKGLAISIKEGVTELINKHGKLIILEDDLVLSKNFLRYMNDGLNAYADIENIYSINGFMFPIGFKEQSTFLLPYTSTWGWATWKNRWAIFQPEIDTNDKAFIQTNAALKTRFDLSEYSYSDMLDYGNNSWGIKWYYSIFLKNGLNVFPTLTLVQNIGNDGSGTNYSDSEESGLFNENNVVKLKVENNLNLNHLSLYLSYFQRPKSNKVSRLIDKFLK